MASGMSEVFKVVLVSVVRYFLWEHLSVSGMKTATVSEWILFVSELLFRRDIVSRGEKFFKSNSFRFCI